MIKFSEVTFSLIRKCLSKTILNSSDYPAGSMGFISFEFNETTIYLFFHFLIGKVNGAGCLVTPRARTEAFLYSAFLLPSIIKQFNL